MQSTRDEIDELMRKKFPDEYHGIDHEIKKEIAHFQKTGVPRCIVCKKDLVYSIDSVTGKKSKYIWKPDCEHSPNLRMSLG